MRCAAAAAAVCIALSLACSPWVSSSAYKQKLVVLGFDGLDPDLTRAWMRDGKLPNFAKIAEQGGIHDLATTHSPDGAPAWASFATGVNAGKHNIFDSFVRDPHTYRAHAGLVRETAPRFLFNYFPLTGPQLTALRGGTSFWVTAGAAGVRSSVLGVPLTFPPEDVPNGELLAGLPLPDIRGARGAFSYFATNLPLNKAGPSEFGGMLTRLEFQHSRAQAEIVGPLDPTGEDVLTVPFTITWNREARTANLDVRGQTIHLGERGWSRWIDLEFRVNAVTRLHGMAQFYLIRAGTDLQLYVSAVNWHPDAPPSAITSPSSFAGELYERLGPYRTIGWPESAWALADGHLDEAAFLEDLDRAFEDRAETILNRIDARNWELLIGVIDTTDRVQHMMWRMIDPQHPAYDAALARRYAPSIEQMYRRADEFAGDVLARLEPGTTIMIVSTHGFHPFRWSVNLNSWLVQEGYLTLQPGTATPDWSKTRAYALGLSQIYVNLKGREDHGVVSAGAEYDALVDALAADVMTLTDPQSGARVVRKAYKRRDIYSGPFVDNASDLHVGFETGYRASWQTIHGGVPARVIEPNLKPWSGDHSSADHETTAGVFITNRRFTASTTRVIDVAPTVLKYFGVTVPSDLDGRPLFH